MVVTVMARDDGHGGDNDDGDDQVINSYSPRSPLPQQMLVHRFCVPGGWVSNRVSG